MLRRFRFPLLIALVSIVYFLAVGVDTMDEDASQYASMSREMKESGSYLQVYEQGKDYLDKPPFLFWINSVSMHVFGENNFAFKLPSILFAILAVFATFRFARLYYEESIAKLAAIVLATCQALFLITNDIRTDTILMGWVALAIWLLAEWEQKEENKYFLLASVAIGFGMVTKGPIALIVPVFAFAPHFILKRKFSYLFKPVYLVGLLLIGVILLPMSIGLYLQFDLHPEKSVYGLSHVSGLRFFYWTQSFGRITGESTWNNHAPFSFLFENLLWGMLPWTIFFIAGLVKDWTSIIRKKFRLQSTDEIITVAGFLLTYCSLAISKYQLPHYIYVVLPLIAVSTAKAINSILTSRSAAGLKIAFTAFQYLVLAVLLLAPIVILKFAFPAVIFWPWLLVICGIIAAIVIWVSSSAENKLINTSVAVILSINCFLSLWFYPQLLKYQAGNVVGRYVADHNIPKENFFLYKYTGSARNIHFYSKRIVTTAESIQQVKAGTYLLTMEEGLKDIQLSGRSFQLVKKGEDFHVTSLTGKFLNQKTRSESTRIYYLVKVMN